jgi:hypothetical protein
MELAPNKIGMHANTWRDHFLYKIKRIILARGRGDELAHL